MRLPISIILAFAVSSCGDPDIAIHSEALRLSKLIDRLVLKLENVGWLHSDPFVGPCKTNFEPKYCQSVAISRTERRPGGEYLFNLRFPVGRNCEQVPHRLAAYRADATRVRELIDASTIDTVHLKAMAKANLSANAFEKRYRSENRRYDPVGNFFTSRDALATIRDLQVDCSVGTIALTLHCKSCR